MAVSRRRKQPSERLRVRDAMAHKFVTRRMWRFIDYDNIYILCISYVICYMFTFTTIASIIISAIEMGLEWPGMPLPKACQPLDTPRRRL